MTKASCILKTLIPLLLGLAFSSPLTAAFKLPKTETLTLDNGLQVHLVPQKEVPLVHISLGILAGSTVDGDTWGIADLTANALSLGTKQYSKSAIEEKLDFYGIEFEPVVGKDLTYLSASLASADLKTFLPVLADMVIAPRFPPKEVDKLQDRQTQALVKAKESPNRIADDSFERILFAGSAYASPAQGVAETVAKLKAPDLKGFHTRHYQPQLSSLTIAGDFDAAALKAEVVRAFSGWKRGKTARAEPSAKGAAGGQVVLLDKKDAQETTFRIGGVGVSRDFKDQVPLKVVNTVLGGRFTSLLNEELRIKSGYTYGARSGFAAWKEAGSFSISTFTAEETTFKTLDLALATYRKFYEKGIDQKTLDSAKAYVKGQFAPTLETLGALARITTDIWAYGLDPALINDFEPRVDALSVQDANALIKKHFPEPGQLTILMIGKASEIQAKAAGYGTLKTRELKAIDSAKPL